MKSTIAVSTWSVHRKLGYSFANGPGKAAPFVRSETWGPGEFGILELPAELAQRGYVACEVCHFHIGSLDSADLHVIRERFARSGVVIQTLLVDDGDITNPATRDRDLSWIESWIAAGALLGAHNVRVIAGKAPPTPASLALAVDGLRRLVDAGERHGISVVTENWFDLVSTPAAVHHVLDAVPGLGFLADTGNWSGPGKYADLASIFARAKLCHAKAALAPGLMLDEADFSACLSAAREAHYAGPLTLIFADEGDEWQGLEVERQFIQRQS